MTDSMNCLMRVSHLSHSYADHSILSDVSFSITDSERVVVLGSNGCGKSSLLKIMNGLITPQQGEVFFKDYPITLKGLKKDANLQRLFRSQVCLLFQNPDAMIFNPTVYDEIAFGLRQLKRDNVDDRVHYWADQIGIRGLLHRTPFTLSGGEKQKVCLAALLALEPKLLLLDEPTSAMDPRATGWLVDFLNGLGITTLISTHNLSLASELGTRALVLSEDHRLIYDGEIAPLFDNLSIFIQANLVHAHKHKHGDQEHTHVHLHDWD